MGFYFRNVTETVLFGIRGSLRTLDPGRRQVNIMSTRKERHSKKPDNYSAIANAVTIRVYGQAQEMRRSASLVERNELEWVGTR